MFENLSFEYPYVVLLFLLFLLLQRYAKADGSAYYIPHFYEKLPHVKGKAYVERFLKWLVVISALIALASPVVVTGMKKQESQSIDIVLSLDASGSMSLTGFNLLDEHQSRWDVVKEVVKDFIVKREKDRIGLVIFADYAAVASPLTYAKEAQFEIVKGIELGVVGKSTALVDGLTSAITLLKTSQKSSKVIVLLSDGEDTASKIPLDVAMKFAKKYDVKVYTVAIDKGRSNILKLIAKESGGKSFHANTKEDLYEVYRTIDSLERSAIPDKDIKIIHYYAFHILGLTLFASFLLLLIMKRRGGF